MMIVSTEEFKLPQACRLEVESKEILPEVT